MKPTLLKENRLGKVAASPFHRRNHQCSLCLLWFQDGVDRKMRCSHFSLQWKVYKGACRCSRLDVHMSVTYRWSRLAYLPDEIYWAWWLWWLEYIGANWWCRRGYLKWSGSGFLLWVGVNKSAREELRRTWVLCGSTDKENEKKPLSEAPTPSKAF